MRSFVCAIADVPASSAAVPATAAAIFRILIFVLPVSLSVTLAACGHLFRACAGSLATVIASANKNLKIPQILKFLSQFRISG
jgi:hypothetical protein